MIGRSKWRTISSDNLYASAVCSSLAPEKAGFVYSFVCEEKKEEEEEQAIATRTAITRAITATVIYTHDPSALRTHRRAACESLMTFFLLSDPELIRCEC